MAELNIGGEAFHVVFQGDEDAPVLMLSNAMGTNLHMWEPQIEALLKHYRVLRYDARGHGDSVVTEGPYSIAELGRDALAILDALGLEKVDFLGLSLGGMVGQWLLTHAPRRIGKAILADTAAQLPPPDLWNSRIQSVLQDGMGAVASGLIENWFTKDFRDQHPEEVSKIEDMILRTPPQGYAATSAAIRDADLREAIRSITMPVLVLVGRHDTVAPQGIAALLTSAIPKAKLAVLEAAHLSNIEDAAQFNEKALEFLLAEEPVEEPVPEPKPKAPRKPRVKKAPAVTPVLEVVVEAAPVAKPKPAPVKKAAPKKTAAKKAAPKKKAAAKKAPVKKAAAKKAAPKKAAVKKVAVKKAAAKKAAPKKAMKKSAAKKAAAKKMPVKKAAVKKTAVKKSAVKKTAAKKMPVKKMAVKKAAPKKAMKKPVKKAAAKKAKRR